MGVSMAEWEEAYSAFRDDPEHLEHAGIRASDAFFAGARWMARRASDHLAEASKSYIERDDETHLLIAHIHTDMEVECLRDLGDWGTTQTGDE
jgi:hypothetical protein